MGCGGILSRVKECGVYLDLRVTQGGDYGESSWAPDLHKIWHKTYRSLVKVIFKEGLCT